MIKRKIRKAKHLGYLSRTISDLHWEIINVTIQSTNIGWTDNTTSYMLNCAQLIKKYERRRLLIKY